MKILSAIGSTLFMLCLFISVPIWVLGLLLIFWCPLNIRLLWVRQWGRLMRFLLFVFCGIRIKILGRENIPQEPVIYFVKHQSAWETTVLPGILPFHVFILKKELMKIPFFGWGLKLIKAVPIDRSRGLKALKDVINIGKSRLAKGVSIVMFPEGTRVAYGEHPKIHKSGMMLAKNTYVDVIPIAHNAGKLWPRRGWIKKPGVITLQIGQPISTRDKTLETLSDEVYEWMKATCQQLET